MAADMTKTKVKAGSKKAVHLPTKQTINLAAQTAKPTKLRILIPVIVLLAVLVAVAGKFAVYDRIMQVLSAQSQVYQLRAELNVAYDRLANYDELSDIYAHYTYSGMSARELSRVDRTQVVALIQNVVIPEVIVDNWSVSENTLTMNVTGPSLQALNLLVQKLNAEDIVDFSTLRNAYSSEATYKSSSDTEAEMITRSDVTAQIVAYLAIPEAEDQP